MILGFFFLLFDATVEREVKHPASGVGFGSSLEQDRPQGLWGWDFLHGDAINSLPASVQQRIMF